MIITSEATKDLFERAEMEIRGNIEVGAINEYVDGDSATEYLSQLIAIHQGMKGNADTVDAKVGDLLQSIVDKIIENNVHFVAEQIARNV